MVVCGNTIFVVNSSGGSVFLITGTNGIVNILNILKDLNDAFMIYTDESVMVTQCLKLLQEAYTFHKAAKMAVHEKYNLQCKALHFHKGVCYLTLLTVLLCCETVFPQYRRITSLFMTSSVQLQLAPSQMKHFFHWLETL